MTAVASNSVELGLPLVVDLDETLIKSDLLIEAVFKMAGNDPFSVFSLFYALVRGKANFKDVVAHASHLDPVSLPYDEVVLDLIRKALTAGGQFISRRPAMHNSFPPLPTILGFLPAGSAPTRS